MNKLGVMAAFHKSAFDKLSCTPIDECQTGLGNIASHNKKGICELDFFFFALFGSPDHYLQSQVNINKSSFTTNCVLVV